VAPRIAACFGTAGLWSFDICLDLTVVPGFFGNGLFDAIHQHSGSVSNMIREGLPPRTGLPPGAPAAIDT
jgi:hypothetical protein